MEIIDFQMKNKTVIYIKSALQWTTDIQEEEGEREKER